MRCTSRGVEIMSSAGKFPPPPSKTCRWPAPSRPLEPDGTVQSSWNVFPRNALVGFLENSDGVSGFSRLFPENYPVPLFAMGLIECLPFSRPATVHRAPVTAPPGTRQFGNTILSRMNTERLRGSLIKATAKQEARIFDLDSLVGQQRLMNPELLSGSISGLIFLDEIHRRSGVVRSSFPIFNWLR